MMTKTSEERPEILLVVDVDQGARARLDQEWGAATGRLCPPTRIEELWSTFLARLVELCRSRDRISLFVFLKSHPVPPSALAPFVNETNSFIKADGHKNSLYAARADGYGLSRAIQDLRPPTIHVAGRWAEECVHDTVEGLKGLWVPTVVHFDAVLPQAIRAEEIDRLKKRYDELAPAPGAKISTIGDLSVWALPRPTPAIESR